MTCICHKMKKFNAIVCVLFLCLVCVFAKESDHKNRSSDLYTYEEFTDMANEYAAKHDPFLEKPDFCNDYEVCGGCVDQDFPMFKNCDKWCKSPCMCYKRKEEYGSDEFSCARHNCGKNFPSKLLCDLKMNFNISMICQKYKLGCWKLIVLERA